ncbi:hypothetical protein RRF57_011084 [Xylaria bambusicola]|uniref:Uncharacterized protein n=1 Tax=Xylaria bambusicola TaxID=326684 RepID=A0AAN7Z9D7_9PEZI
MVHRQHNEQGYLSLKADFTNPEPIPALFEAAKIEFKAAPSVIIYNVAALTLPPDQGSVLSIRSSSVASDLKVNTVSPYAAAQQVVAAWEMLHGETKKIFIYTGNILREVVLPVPLVQNLGIDKAASAYWIGLADTLYAAKGYRTLTFLHADERHEDGKIKVAQLDDPAHAEFYAELAKHEGKIPWNVSFVKGKGYVQF